MKSALLVLFGLLSLTGCDGLHGTPIDLGDGRLATFNRWNGRLTVYQVDDRGFRRLVDLARLENKKLTCSSDISNARVRVGAEIQWIAGQVFWTTSFQPYDPDGELKVKPSFWLETFKARRSLYGSPKANVQLIAGTSFNIVLDTLEVTTFGTIEILDSNRFVKNGSSRISPEIFDAAISCDVSWAGFEDYPVEGLEAASTSTG